MVRAVAPKHVNKSTGPMTLANLWTTQEEHTKALEAPEMQPHIAATMPLLEGMPQDMCQCPHWGFVLNGRITTTDAAGKQETVTANDLFYWPPGHNVRVDEDASILMQLAARKDSQAHREGWSYSQYVLRMKHA